jgi:hypothetical protein
LLTFALLTSTGGCRGSAHPTTTTCLEDPRPVFPRADDTARYAVLRERWEALPTLHPLAQAALLPGLPRWLPQGHGFIPRPACREEIQESLDRDALEERPVKLTRLFVSRLVAGSPDLWERVAALRDDELTPYVRLPDEPPGHAITAVELRAMVSRTLARSPDPKNEARFRRALVTTDDARYLFDLEVQAQRAVDRHYTDLPSQQRHGGEGRAVLRREIALLRAWFEAPYEGARFELALRWLRRLGRNGANYQIADDVHALLAPVLERRGDVVLAREREGARFDLWLAALTADYELRHPAPNRGQGLSLPRASLVGHAPPADGYELSRLVQASVPLPPPVRRAVLSLLDGQIRRIEVPSVRCALLEERVTLTLPDERLAFLRPRLPDVPASGEITTYGEEHLCALQVLKQVPTLDADARRRLLALARDPRRRPVPILALGRLDGDGPGLSVDAPRQAARVLLDRAEELLKDPEGRAWLEESALADASEGLSSGDPGSLRLADLLMPRWLAGEGDRERASEVVRRWIASSIASLKGPAPGSLGAFERFAAVHYAIARWAPGAGLRDEAARHFAEAHPLVLRWAPSLADGERDLPSVLVVAEAVLAAEP